MSDFKKQIEEDFKEYRSRLDNVDNIEKDEWLFNYWILDKFFYEDEELILDKITDYNDKGVDAFEWYEDTKELYLIQNKFYSTSRIDEDYVENTFLLWPIEVLEKGSYRRSKDLQEIYTKNKDLDNFTVNLEIYVTNDLVNDKVTKVIQKFNSEHRPKYSAKIYYLSDIEEKWYGQKQKITKEFEATIESVNNHTILSVNNDDYHLENNIDAKYAFTPVSCIYTMVKEAKEKQYPLFESNIREYLGNKGINKNILSTLQDQNERKNFFYYNNGITLICDRISKTDNKNDSLNSHVNVSFSVKNPQIVNGCQTVNSIYLALKEYEENDIDRLFNETFVMLKVLQIDSSDNSQKIISENIVKYNNSQNAIDEKTFIANSELFQRYKYEFEKKGFLLITKQSDTNTYKEKYSKNSALSKLKGISTVRRTIFGLEQIKNVSDLLIPLEKLLQVILAFKEGGHTAYTKKKDVLKQGTAAYNTVTNFFKASTVTTDVLLDLYCLFLRSEKDKKKAVKNTAASPIPFYVIDGFSKYECHEKTVSEIQQNLSSKEKVNELLKLYSLTCSYYCKAIASRDSVDYNSMIKKEVDYGLLSTQYENAKEALLLMKE